jgi:hypothetical protein
MNDAELRAYVEQQLAQARAERGHDTPTEGEESNGLLFDRGQPWDDHWQAAPEFVQVNRRPFKTIYVHFETRADMEAFAKLISQKVTDATRYFWYPPPQDNEIWKMRYVDEEDAKPEPPEEEVEIEDPNDMEQI